MCISSNLLVVEKDLTWKILGWGRSPAVSAASDILKPPLAAADRS